MKFTSFNPLIITKDAAAAIRLFEALGFEKKHTHSTPGGFVDTTMKDANGFQVDIADVPNTPRDHTIIRINVDDFDEAYEFLTARGFVHPSGTVEEDESSKSTMMVSPSGFAFDLAYHKKK